MKFLLNLIPYSFVLETHLLFEVLYVPRLSALLLFISVSIYYREAEECLCIVLAVQKKGMRLRAFWMLG